MKKFLVVAGTTGIGMAVWLFGRSPYGQAVRFELSIRWAEFTGKPIDRDVARRMRFAVAQMAAAARFGMKPATPQGMDKMTALFDGWPESEVYNLLLQEPQKPENQGA